MYKIMYNIILTMTQADYFSFVLFNVHNLVILAVILIDYTMNKKYLENEDYKTI